MSLSKSILYQIDWKSKIFEFRSYIFFSVLTLNILISTNLQAEGTKQIMPYDTCLSRLNFEPSFTNFAQYGCLPSERLHINISQIGEKVYYGFGSVYDAQQFIMTDLVYRIKDPLGNIVVSQSGIPTIGNGFISSHAKALAGPNIINPTGYIPLSFTPTSTGDYYIEFYYPSQTLTGNRRELEYFDITVVGANNQPIDGRVWSKEWQFTVTASPQPNPYDYPFYGKMYIYSDDSIVTSVNFNGLKPYVFAMTANATGTDNTGNTILDRKSKLGKHTYPQYKIFLNDPDSNVYPSGILGMFLSPLSFTGCPGTQCINVHTNKDGPILLLIDLNGIPGYQIGTTDVLIVQNVNAGLSCIPWNGLDGFGNPVPSGTTIDFKVTFAAGLTHMPIYDAEHNPNGYIINLVRPINNNTTFSLYWDDSNFPGAVTPPSMGCLSTTGCHIFNNLFGNLRTINTWWYATNNITDSLELIYTRLQIDSLVPTNATCPYLSDGSIQVYASGGALPLSYSINGGPLQSSPVFQNLGIGNYTIMVIDSLNCMEYDSISIESAPPISATLTATHDTCLAGLGTISLQVDTGIAPFQYLWNNSPPSTISSPTGLVAGVYTVQVTDSFNCTYLFTDTINNIPTSIQITPIVLHDTCSNNMGQISLNISNAIQPITYSWNTTPVQVTNTITNLGAGTYTVVVSENATCHTTLVLPLQNMPAPSPLFALPDKACVDDSITISYIGNQTPPDNFIWGFSSATVLAGSGTGPYAISFSNPGKYGISLGVSKVGCPSSDLTDSIELFELYSSIDSNHEAHCFGSSDGYLSINVGGGVPPYSYFWNPGGAGSYFNNQLQAGLYQINIVDSIGCKNTISDLINEPDELEITLIQKKTSCVYKCDGILSSLITGGTFPYTYHWTPNNFGASNSINKLCTGYYNLKVVDAQNCVDTARILLEVNSPILADFTYEFHSAFTERNTADFTFTGFGATDFIWDFGDFSTSTLRDPTHYYPIDSNYRIELIVNSGYPDYCYDTTEKWITVLPPFSIFVPDAFTPNGDGLNDRFVVVGNYIKEYNILIFNRWGKLIFQGSNIEDHWDGRYEGVEAPGAVYTYIIEVVGTNNKKDKISGRITLVR